MIKTQKALRAAFWRDNPDASRRMIPAYSGKGRIYCTDTRVAWCEYIDAQARAGIISEGLASRATLQPYRATFEFDIQGNYGQGWETENTELSRLQALRSLREYRENGPGEYRMVRRRVLVARGE